MEILKKILSIIFIPFYFIFLIFSRGFAFILYWPFLLIYKITKSTIFETIYIKLRKLGEQPMLFVLVLLVFIILVLVYITVYDIDSLFNLNDHKEYYEVVKPTTIEEDVLEASEDYQLYKKFSDYTLNQINISELQKENPDVVGWLIVDGTNINYPIVQTSDNDFYINNNFYKKPVISGWPFMDYRNNPIELDKNMIFYSHNLLNNTGFGSVSNIFTKEWFNTSSHNITYINSKGTYNYEIFSNYYIEPVVDYLKINFNDDNEYMSFLNTLKDRSIFNFGVSLKSTDKIITLSTCTDDNKGRKVVHARLKG